MPLVRIDIVKGVRSPDQVKKLADVVQRVLLDHFNAPPRDRYQVCLLKLWPRKFRSNTHLPFWTHKKKKGGGGGKSGQVLTKTIVRSSLSTRATSSFARTQI
jgi:hypothetical protein